MHQLPSSYPNLFGPVRRKAEILTNTLPQAPSPQTLLAKSHKHTRCRTQHTSPGGRCPYPHVGNFAFHVVVYNFGSTSFSGSLSGCPTTMVICLEVAG